MLDDEVVIRLLERGAVLSADGRRLGRVGQLFRSDTDGESTWVSIDAGDAGMQTLVPMAGSTVEGDDLRVGYPAGAIIGAPQVAVGAPVSGDDERKVRAFYHPEPAGDPGAQTEVASVVRSEERLSVTSQWVPVRRARLEKFQVTETKTIEVPWIREDVRVVYEPLDGAAGEPVAGTPRPWVLQEERIVVTKEWVPAQTVWLAVDRVAGEQEVSEPVRIEQVVLDPIEPTGLAADQAGPANEQVTGA